MNPSGERGAPDALDTQFRHVAQLAANGDLGAARTGLRRLAAQAREQGRPLEAGRAWRLSAALDRVLGDWGDAVAAATQAVELSAGDRRATQAALDELGEALLRTGQPTAAAEAFGRAAEHAGADAVPLRRKQAYALASAGQSEQAKRLLIELGESTGSPAERAAMLVQAAASADMWQVDQPADPRTKHPADDNLWRAAHEAVDAAEAPGLHADLAFIAAARALDAGDADLALRHVRAARRYALDAVAPLAYVAACIAESTLAETQNDDVRAYGSLATGYATLGDLVGRTLSASTFDGPLRDLRSRWGADRFTAAKTAYESTRRRS